MVPQANRSAYEIFKWGKQLQISNTLCLFSFRSQERRRNNQPINHLVYWIPFRFIQFKWRFSFSSFAYICLIVEIAPPPLLLKSVLASARHALQTNRPMHLPGDHSASLSGRHSNAWTTVESVHYANRIIKLVKLSQFTFVHSKAFGLIVHFTHTLKSWEWTPKFGTPNAAVNRRAARAAPTVSVSLSLKKMKEIKRNQRKEKLKKIINFKSLFIISFLAKTDAQSVQVMLNSLRISLLRRCGQRECYRLFFVLQTVTHRAAQRKYAAL